MTILTVGLKDRSYQITIAFGCLKNIGQELVSHFKSSRYCIVADDTVAELYGHTLLDSIRKLGLRCDLLSFPHGEANKTLNTVARLASGAAQLGIDRKSMFIALGGGVTGDITGFLAASFLRGVPFIQVPTTLLAQVDSSVGGKTGVDIPEGKNLVGAFYQPLAVYIDPDVLKTLPQSEYLSGLAEVIKHGVIKDPDFLLFLKNNQERIMSLEHDAVVKMIRTNCRIKADVVAGDEKESDTRRILNYGHTIGHAVEATSRFSISHGFAVSIGMVAAGRIAVMKGLLSEEQAQEIIALLKQYKLPTEVPPDLDRTVIKSYLLTDKKNIGGRIFYILLKDDGDLVITGDVPDDHVDAVLNFKP